MKEKFSRREPEKFAKTEFVNLAEKTIKECNMTAYENLKRKENILSGASLRASSPDMKVMWLAKAKELKKR